MKQLFSNCKLNGQPKNIARFMENFKHHYLHVYVPKMNVPDADLVMLGYVDGTEFLIIQVSRAIDNDGVTRYAIQLFVYDKNTNSFKLASDSSVKLVEIVHSILGVKGRKTVTTGHCEVLFKGSPADARLIVLHDGNQVGESKNGQTYRFKTPTTERKCKHNTYSFPDNFTGLLAKLQELKAENAYDKYTIDGDVLHCTIDRQVEGFVIREVKLPDDETAMKIAKLVSTNSIAFRRDMDKIVEHLNVNTVHALREVFTGKKVIVEKRYHAYKNVGEV